MNNKKLWAKCFTYIENQELASREFACCHWHALRWRHNDHDGVSNHQPRGCLLNRLFRRRSKKTSKLRVTGLCEGNSTGPANSPHKGPVTRKMFPFDDVIMGCREVMTGHRNYCHGALLLWTVIIMVLNDLKPHKHRISIDLHDNSSETIVLRLCMLLNSVKVSHYRW